MKFNPRRFHFLRRECRFWWNAALCGILSVTSHINWIVARYLINMVYLKACAFIRPWWRCTFWVTSLMTLNQHENQKLRHFANLKSETSSKLINMLIEGGPYNSLWNTLHCVDPCIPFAPLHEGETQKEKAETQSKSSNQLYLLKQYGLQQLERAPRATP